MIQNAQILNPIESLLVVGQKRSAFFKKLIEGNDIFSLLCLLPSNIMYRHSIKKLTAEYTNELVTFNFTVIEHLPNHRKGAPYKIRGVLTESQEPVELIFFNAYESFLARVARVESTIAISGKLLSRQHNNEWHFQISHPDYMGPQENFEAWVGVERVYPLSAGLTQGIVRSALQQALEGVEETPEWINPERAKQLDFPTWKKALISIHDPKTEVDLSPLNVSRQRLAYDELFAKQLSNYYYHTKNLKADNAVKIKLSSKLLNKLLEKLPFDLTKAQKQAIQEIAADMTHAQPMHRLLQGDVGSGKTLVALASALLAIEGGYQAALLAPTDILARQHYRSIEKFLEGLEVNCCLLTGKEKGKTRAGLLERVAKNEVQLIIGTHAIFQEDVHYHNLALAIIDEQHRFGVKQRLELAQKSNHTHVLSMTATPIPRTLLLAHYGEMQVSQLREKPPGRKAITTKTVQSGKMDEIISYVQQKINNGESVFWVCPLVEESEKLDLAAATKRYEQLHALFGDTVVLTHGKQKSADKEEAFTRFSTGKARVLVATTVIEVGVDVPAATVMIIEHADRFGLAQLHQLRGRIGRGALDGTCLLLYGDSISYVARQRLSMMKKTTDGFELAEADLKLRGGGDTLGLRQSGLPKFRFAVLNAEAEDVYTLYQTLYEYADQDAKELIQSDPNLSSARGQAARLIMHYFQTEMGESFKKAG